VSWRPEGDQRVFSGKSGYGPEDIPYLRGFYPYLAPAWLDHVALVNGIEPPTRTAGFTWCELGCGHGVTPSLLAATNPTGIFHALDLIPAHVAFGRRFADEAGITNVAFDVADLSAGVPDLPGFDYIIAHGVYSWVAPSIRASITALIARHLKPGGLVYVSYDAMPQRTGYIPTQKLLKALSETFPGDSIARMEAAAKIVRYLAALGVPALAEQPLVNDLDPGRSEYLPAYIVHAFLTDSWTPFFVTEIRSLFAEAGLVPAGTATLIENHDDYVLGRRAREILAGIAEPNLRELARDFFIDQSFRRDVFAWPWERLSEEETQERLLSGTFMLRRPVEGAAYSMRTPAGTLRFDNDTSRGIVQMLGAGPTRLSDVAARLRHDPEIVIANAVVLSAANLLRPVEPSNVEVETVNSVILRRFGGPDEIAALALPCGTALPIDSDLLHLLDAKSIHGIASETATALREDSRFNNALADPVPSYLAVLEQLHTLLQPKTYLEIGTWTGASLQAATCASLAIDPKFQLQAGAIGKKPRCLLYQMTSDEFFGSFDPKVLLGGPIDLSFIDGLHLVEFALRDFIAIERHARPTSVIAIHDVLPVNLRMAERQPHWGEAWTGDVWKLVVLLRKYRPDLSLQCLNAAPTGLLLCTNLQPASTVLSDRYAELTKEGALLDLGSYGLARYRAEWAQCDAAIFDTQRIGRGSAHSPQ